MGAGRLLYFHEHGAGCYGTFSYLLSKTGCDLLPMRVLPSLLCAATVYPMAGLRSTDSEGPRAAMLFALGLCLTNVVTTLCFNCIGVVSRSSGVASLGAALFSLHALLFCGFLVTRETLSTHGDVAALLPYTSYLYFFFELVASNELLGQWLTYTPRFDGFKVAPVPVPGSEILAQLGFETGDACERLLLSGLQGGCEYTLIALCGWAAAAFVLSYLLLRFCVTDPH